MKTLLKCIVAFQSGLALVALSAESQRPHSSLTAGSRPPTPRELELAFESSENGATIVALAIERFHHDRKHGEQCILTLSDDIEVSKYSDGKFTVIALPQDAGTNHTGIERFVHSYNHMVIRDADSRLEAGNPDFSERVYKLLLKYDPTSSYSDALRKRISLLAGAKDQRSLTIRGRVMNVNGSVRSIWHKLAVGGSGTGKSKVPGS